MNEYDSEVAHSGNGINTSKTAALRPIWQFAIDRWTPGLAMTNFPGPEQPKALTVPANDGLRLDNDQGRSPFAPDCAQPRPEESICGRQFRPLYRATQDAELVPEGEILQLKSSSRFEGCRRGAANT